MSTDTEKPALPANMVHSLLVEDVILASLQGPMVSSGDPLRDAYLNTLNAAVALRELLLARDGK